MPARTLSVVPATPSQAKRLASTLELSEHPGYVERLFSTEFRFKVTGVPFNIVIGTGLMSIPIIDVHTNEPLTRRLPEAMKTIGDVLGRARDIASDAPTTVSDLYRITGRGPDNYDFLMPCLREEHNELVLYLLKLHGDEYWGPTSGLGSADPEIISNFVEYSIGMETGEPRVIEVPVAIRMANGAEALQYANQLSNDEISRQWHVSVSVDHTQLRILPSQREDRVSIVSIRAHVERQLSLQDFISHMGNFFSNLPVRSVWGGVDDLYYNVRSGIGRYYLPYMTRIANELVVLLFSFKSSDWVQPGGPYGTSRPDAIYEWAMGRAWEFGNASQRRETTGPVHIRLGEGWEREKLVHRLRRATLHPVDERLEIFYAITPGTPVFFDPPILGSTPHEVSTVDVENRTPGDRTLWHAITTQIVPALSSVSDRVMYGNFDENLYRLQTEEGTECFLPLIWEEAPNDFAFYLLRFYKKDFAVTAGEPGQNDPAVLVDFIRRASEMILRGPRTERSAPSTAVPMSIEFAALGAVNAMVERLKSMPDTAGYLLMEHLEFDTEIHMISGVDIRVIRVRPSRADVELTTKQLFFNLLAGALNKQRDVLYFGELADVYAQGHQRTPPYEYYLPLVMKGRGQANAPLFVLCATSGDFGAVGGLHEENYAAAATLFRVFKSHPVLYPPTEEDVQQSVRVVADALQELGAQNYYVYLTRGYRLNFLKRGQGELDVDSIRAVIIETDVDQNLPSCVGAIGHAMALSHTDDPLLWIGNSLLYSTESAQTEFVMCAVSSGKGVEVPVLHAIVFVNQDRWTGSHPNLQVTGYPDLMWRSLGGDQPYLTFAASPPAVHRPSAGPRPATPAEPSPAPQLMRPQGPSIASYHSGSRPPWRFRGKPENKVFYGVELEIIHGSGKTNRYVGAAEAIAQYRYIRLGRERKEWPWIIVEYDGSLRDDESGEYYGFEVIFHPVSPQFAREHEDLFGVVLETLAGHGMISYGSVKFRKSDGVRIDCGQHVSVTREPISPLSQVKLLSLFYNNPDFMWKVSRRSWAALKDWASVQRPKVEGGYELSYAEIVSGKAEADKYTALNFKPDVIEIRMFRGTLKLESFMMNLQFSEAAVEFCMDRHYGLTDMSVENFVRYICRRERDFVELTAWMREKGITDGYC